MNQQDCYQNFNNPFTPNDPLVNRDARHLTKLSILAGGGVLGFTVVRYAFSAVMMLLGVTDSNISFSLNAVLTIMISVLGVYVPFVIVYRFYSPKDKENCFSLDLPKSKNSFWYALGGGTMICFLGNYITSGFAGFVSTYDIEFSQYDADIPQSIGEFFLYVFQIAIIPAIVEEVAIRGIIMPPLRKYGDRFAIVMSAVIFALMHSNITQIPFAFVAGLALGYFSIATGSVWTAVAIHAANNFIAVLSVIAAENAFGSFAFSVLTVAITIVGIYCIKQFVKLPHNGLGLTFAPKSERKFLLASGAVFVFISFVYSVYSGRSATPYILTFLLFYFCLRRYLKANKRILAPVAQSSLNLKQKVYLYCCTPTVVLGFILIATTTIQSITVTSSVGYIFFYGGIFALLALAIYMIYKILNSKVLEDKGTYKKTLVIIICVCAFSVISSWFSQLLIY